MKYLHEILWYLSLPLTVVVSYFAARWALNLFHKGLAKEASESEESKE